jgi:exo-1,4-beta-D-glucosaminidase
MFRSLILCLALFAIALPAAPAPAGRMDLAAGWEIQSSAVSGRGEWFPARVPSSVVSTLVDNRVLPSPYTGMNLRAFPGIDYAIGENFSEMPMSFENPFAVSWWYRTQFRVPADLAARERLWLHFDSINYRANIWVNGRQVADYRDAAGVYRRFEFDITDAAARDGINLLSVQVFPPTENDLALTFVDWNPMPPDKNMGLPGAVYLTGSGPVTVRHTQVVSRVAATLDRAQLTLFANLRNTGAEPAEGILAAAVGAVSVEKPVRLAPGESTRVSFVPDDFPQLTLANPALWWPNGMGPQNLHQLHMEFRSTAGVSDSEDVQFGIREFSSELDDQQHRLFRVNGKRVLIRGGGWTRDMLLRVDDEREENELRYAREMNLNTLRLEGSLMTDHFFDTADRMGLLVMPGWSCCSFWEQWDRWTDDDYRLAGESMRDQARRLRNHAGVFVFLYGSFEAPLPRVEDVYLSVLREENWPHPTLSSGVNQNTFGGGRTGLRAPGPYDYVPPGFWLLDRQGGGANGFSTESTPGAAIPVRASLEQMVGDSPVWPMSEIWDYHSGGGRFNGVGVFLRAMEERYGRPRDLDDFLRKSQIMTYEGERAMFEGFRRNQYASATGVIQWMVNNGWPSLVWHLFDYYLRTGGGYFGTRKANEPVHVQYSYDDSSIVVVNSLQQPVRGYTVTARVFNLDLTERFSRTQAVNVSEDSMMRAFMLPAIEGLSSTYFLRLSLQDESGAVVSSNFYWLSTTPDVLDPVQSDGRHTPLKRHAELTDLEKLPPARLTVEWRSEQSGPEQVEWVTVKNPSSSLAFGIHLTVRKAPTGEDLAPVFWDDNYFELFPGEERRVKATYAKKLLAGEPSSIQVEGWNVARN